MSKPRKSYTKEEKLQIVKLSIEDDQKIDELAKRFEICRATIYNWRSEFLQYKNNAFPGKGNQKLTDEQRKIKDLERENRELKLERDILKKAVGIFSKTDKKFSNL